MKKGWTKVAFGDVFDLDLDAVSVDASAEYQMVGVLSYGRGLFSKPPVGGADTSYKTFFRLHSGQLVVSQLFGWEGAIAPVTSEFEGSYVSSQFPTFRPKANLDAGFARWLVRNPTVWAQLKGAAKGLGDRRRTLSPEIFFGVTSMLPPMAEQQRIVAHLDAIESRLTRAQKLREETIKEAEAFTTSLHLAAAKGRVVRLAQLLHLDEKPVAITSDGSYPQVGIRSFGLGLFKKPPVLGANTTYRAFNVLRSGQFVMSQVKGWEGALGVAGEDYDGWFASPEYRTFSCINEECDSWYLAHIVATSWFRKQLLAATQGIGARRERVRPEMLLGLEMPFPVISRQIEAARLLEKQVAGKRLSAQSAEREAALLPSLLDRIFKS
jgi:type I restriction enzyme, S subunit